MKNNVKLYEITLDSEVFAISLVEDPAIEEDFIYLSKAKPVFLENEEKRIVIGPVLIPNKPIYRNDGANEYYIQFSEKTIEDLSHKFMINGFYQNFTKEHQTDINDISVIETWIKTSDNDKSKDYGYDLPNGTWFAACKINNEEVWQSIKNGEVKGFSIEAFVNLNEINQNINMQKENLEAIEVTANFWDKLRQIISEALGKPQESEEVEKTVGEIVDEMEVSGGSKEEEPKVVEMEIQEPTKEEAVIDVIEKVNEEVIVEEDKAETMQAVIDELQAKVDALNEEIVKKDEEIAMLKDKAEKLSKQPSTDPINKNNKNENKVSFLDFAQGKIRY